MEQLNKKTLAFKKLDVEKAEDVEESFRQCSLKSAGGVKEPKWKIRA